MMALIVCYGQPDPPHVHRWTVDVTDVDTARRVAGQLWRRYRDDSCSHCPADRYTVSIKHHVTGLWRIAATGSLLDASTKPPSPDADQVAMRDRPRTD